MMEPDLTEELSHETSASLETRDLVAAELDRFCSRYGDRLGAFLWEGRFSDFALIAAELVEGDIAVWFAEEGALVPVFNGPRSDRLYGKYAASFRSGILGQSFAMEQSFGGSGDGIDEDASLLDPGMDRHLGIRTVSFLATPLYFGASLRGVVSVIRFVEANSTSPTAPIPFDQAETQRFECLVDALGRLFDERIFAKCFGIR